MIRLFKRAETVSRDFKSEVDHYRGLYLIMKNERDDALAKIARMQGGLSKGTIAAAAKRKAGA